MGKDFVGEGQSDYGQRCKYGTRDKYWGSTKHINGWSADNGEINIASETFHLGYLNMGWRKIRGIWAMLDAVLRSILFYAGEQR